MQRLERAAVPSSWMAADWGYGVLSERVDVMFRKWHGFVARQPIWRCQVRVKVAAHHRSPLPTHAYSSSQSVSRALAAAIFAPYLRL